MDISRPILVLDPSNGTYEIWVDGSIVFSTGSRVQADLAMARMLKGTK